MDETIDKSSQENLNELKIDISLQDAEEKILKLSRKVKTYKIRVGLCSYFQYKKVFVENGA